MHSNAEKTPSDDRQPLLSRAATKNNGRSAPRGRKECLLPQIRDLALEGHDCREIGARLGVSKTSVHRWLQELRQECRGKVADATEMIANAAARYDSIYREAMEAWRSSKADKQIRFVEETEADGGGSKKKRSIRTEGRAGDVAFLAKAKEAVDAFCKLVPREALRGSKAAEPENAPIDLYAVTDDDLRHMSNAELAAFRAEIQAKIAEEEAAEKAADAAKSK